MSILPFSIILPDPPWVNGKVMLRANIITLLAMLVRYMFLLCADVALLPGTTLPHVSGVATMNAAMALAAVVNNLIGLHITHA